MTICVAVVARGQNADGDPSDVIVTASDRMVTLGGKTEYVWRDQTKSFWFSRSIIALTADDPDLALEISRAAKQSLEGKELTVQKVAMKVAQKFREHRARRNERRILSPHGLTFETLIDNEHKLAPTTLQRIRNQLFGDEGVLNATMIIAGFDGSEGHIFLVDDPGDYVTCDSEGFAAIGLGREHAESVFAESQYTHWVPLDRSCCYCLFGKEASRSRAWGRR